MCRKCLGCEEGLNALSNQGVDGLIACVRQHGQRVAVLDQITGNAMTHHANADHSDFFHDLSLLM
jgi:hypothetical protein